MVRTSFLEVNAPTVISEVIDGEAVIMNMATGRYFSCQGVGGEIWSMIEDGTTKESIRHRLQDRYAVESPFLDQSLDGFLANLREHDLIREAGPAGGNGGSPGTEDEGQERGEGAMADGNSTAPGTGPATFRPPELNVYSDMEDLLLLDPIHDVDETGWPQPKSDGAGNTS